jgi:DNA-binding response OmpR family regulator
MPVASVVLIIDDDPMHLRIYGWIVEAAGYASLPAQVMHGGVELPEGKADLVLLDYNFVGTTTAVELAQRVRASQPELPILVLSDAFSLPDDIAPHVQGFIRKGDPGKLVDKLREMLGPGHEKKTSDVLNS